MACPMTFVAYQGLPGAYSALAADQYCEKQKIRAFTTRGFKTFEAVFAAVNEGQCSLAVVPVENSVSGTIFKVYDLVNTSGLSVVGEIALAMDHCLCALPGVKKDDIRKVMSSAQVLEQCNDFIRKLAADNSGAEVVATPTWDTAGACEEVAKGLRDAAAVASPQAAEQFGLEVLQHEVGDIEHTTTRYWILKKDPIEVPPTRSLKVKTSIAVSLRNEPMALMKMVTALALRGINITKLESSPALHASKERGALRQFEYTFYVDFEPQEHPGPAEAALKNIQEFARSVRVFGTYLSNMPEPEPLVPHAWSHYM